MRGSKWPVSLCAGASILALSSGALAADAGADRDAAAVEAVIVTAPRQEEKARQVQLKAPNLINVQAAETIAKYPDFNAAEALGRIPGISLSTDTGEGRFVNIRGIDANLNGATYGGVVLLNTNAGGTAAGGGGRAVEFDTIPTGAIDGIIVTKTRLPEQEGEGLGGTIELTPRNAASITKPFIEGALGWGLQPLHDHTGPFTGEVAVGGRFGFHNGHLVIEGVGDPAPAGSGFISNPTPFSFVLNYSRKDDRRGIDDLEESYADIIRKTISQYDFRRYDYHRRRFAYGGEFDFRPNDDHSYYIRANEAGYIEAVHKNFLLLRDLDGGVNGPLDDGTTGPTGNILADPNDSKGFVSTTRPTTTLTDEQETHRNQVFAVGGHDQFGGVLVDYRASYSRATFDVGYNLGARFFGPSGTPIAYDNRRNNEFPTFNYITDGTHPTPFNPNDASQYRITDIAKSISNSTEHDQDEESAYAINVLAPVSLINSSDQLKIGAEVRLRDKAVRPTFYDLGNVVTPNPISLATASGPPNIYYEGHYTNGPFIDRYAIRKLYAGLTGIVSGVDPNGYFKARENIYAGYGQYSTEIGKFSFLAGVRVENTQGLYSANVNADGAFSFQNRTEDYTDAFPTAQVKYTIAPNLIVRGIYSTGIARPGFEQNNATASVDTTTNPGTATISRGNPALKPITGNNFDLSVEYYMPHAGILQIGVFDKEFDNYIVPRVQRNVTDPFDVALVPPTAAGDQIDVTTFLNISSAYARGFEAAYHQKFSGLMKPFDGLGFDGNLTIVHSRILEYPGQNGSLPGTSHVTWNAAAFYEAYGAEVRLSAEYVGPSLFALGGDKADDTIQDKRLTLDLTSSYDVTQNFRVYFDAKNLLNTPLRYYQGASDRPIQREFYDVTLEGGVKFKF